ncbi:hypothetical protein HQ945_08965 [Phyllobacterium sp. BT25]|uniref:Uncharacterized protein n=1 Tax=Phyllobacterium pellucidum TaxID=2740464 RepID=A0A849VNA7_9HYPH|nr:hypothetical protein [Phyllobacterium pellucidum]NTS31382.1 hypothetical protein [Phyllobacterium pellucidum]
MEYFNFGASVVSALAAVAAAIIAWRVYRTQSQVDRPAVEVQLERINRHIIKLSVIILNRSDVGLKAESLRVKSPKEATLVAENLVGSFNDMGNWMVDFDALDGSKFDRNTTMSVSIGPRGSKGTRWGEGERQRQDLLLFVQPSSRSRILSMRLTLVSMEAVQRRTTIAITRALDAENSIAAD